MRVSVSLPEELVELIQARAASERRKFSPMLALLAEAGLQATNGSTPVVPPVGGKAFKGMDPKTK